MRNLHVLKKLLMKLLPYIHNLVPPMRNSSRHAKKINMFSCQIDCFKIVVFPSFIAEWDKLGPGIQNSSSESTFNKALLKFISPVASTT